MKRTFKVPFLAPVHTTYTVGLFAFGAAMLFGCPVYSGSTGAARERQLRPQRILLRPDDRVLSAALL